ncbi:hypothetical protein M0804_012695 [Polistes exclamans]|nr:hypothetical protein M0804_012695 [Polistes exclamans]
MCCSWTIGSRLVGGGPPSVLGGAIERWESLASRVEESRMASSLHKELSAMLLEFKASHDRLMAYEIVLKQPHVLDDQINRITISVGNCGYQSAELISLRERKAAMLALNVSAHRLITDLGASTSLIFTALKDGVADLYRVWDETFQRGNQRLCALQTVQQFNVRLSELQCDLRRDKDTLAVLDVALQAGATSEVASSVRHVARLLSEKQEVVHSQNDTVIMNDATIVEVTGCPLAKFTDQQSTTLLSQEGGSLSDSGISDSGSEQELSERERRLAALRRLTRSLENQLDPGSEALAELWKRVEDAERELRDLQKQCRELIVRTAASVESRTVKRMMVVGQQHHYRNDKRKKASSANGEKNIDDEEDDDDSIKDQSEMESAYHHHHHHIGGFGSSSGGGGGGGGVIGAGGCRTKSEDIGDPENEPDIPHSWIWRILRAALPFQLALVALFCAACLLEPHCCEAANTLNLSLTPQLRYVRGPPPV